MFLTFTVRLQPLINILLLYITASPFFTVQGGSLWSFAKYGTEHFWQNPRENWMSSIHLEERRQLSKAGNPRDWGRKCKRAFYPGPRYESRSSTPTRKDQRIESNEVGEVLIRF
ncbi:uncharacterized protein LOC111388505 isoform X5 [Olea europaea var. sylvestris]|uniref:uncharacterized protein LOC111388505 isoform X5 n=1 Tax=Olea europaea var. sylvestris TaxID=158386 RepID=UPI000C1D8D06|nr:uncharacterized protein LOC111388505 isoform X5 [Olea europaea var. sylvestris]